jgi:hypothetical protein
VKVARHKEHFVGRNRTSDFILGTSKGWTLGRRREAQQQCNREIRIETYRMTTGHETMKRITGSPVPSQNSKVWTLWRGRPLPKQKKETENRAGASNVEAPASTARVRKREREKISGW